MSLLDFHLAIIDSFWPSTSAAGRLSSSLRVPFLIAGSGGLMTVEASEGGDRQADCKVIIQAEETACSWQNRVEHTPSAGGESGMTSRSGGDSEALGGLWPCEDVGPGTVSGRLAGRAARGCRIGQPPACNGSLMVLHFKSTAMQRCQAADAVLL